MMGRRERAGVIQRLAPRRREQLTDGRRRRVAGTDGLAPRRREGDRRTARQGRRDRLWRTLIGDLDRAAHACVHPLGQMVTARSERLKWLKRGSGLGAVSPLEHKQDHEERCPEQNLVSRTLRTQCGQSTGRESRA